MQDIINVIKELLPLDINALSLSLATGLATGLVLALKALFALARRLAGKTETLVDDKIVDETVKSFRDKSRDL